MEDLEKRFPSRNKSKCSVGEPGSDGVHIGYEGWGSPDVVISAGVPLGSEVNRIGLAGAFEEVECTNLLHRIHGDCMLTHAVEGVASLAKPGGDISLEFLGMSEILKNALRELDNGMFQKAQALEKLAFGQAVDNEGLLYPQTMISVDKAKRLMSQAGIMLIQVQKDPCLCEATMFPDEIRLEGVEDKVWAESARNFKKREKLLEDRPTCVLCDRVVSKRDQDRQFFSRYCKEHYHEARERCDSALRDTFSVRLTGKRRG